MTLLRAHDAIEWRCTTAFSRYRMPDVTERELRDVVHQPVGWQQAAALRRLGVAPVVEHIEGNLLMYGGVSCLWEWAIGNGTTTANQSTTYISNARAAIGVGSSSTAAAATHTDLQATTDKLRVGMDATYPLHTDGTSSGSASATWSSTFSISQALWIWNEWALFNSSTAATGRMINRKVQQFGGGVAKPNNEVWSLAISLSLA
jgi:hypothetical protein